MTSEADERSNFDRLLDIGVYAPLGFALEFRRIIPELADIGRRQIAFSRSLGRTALSTIARSAANRGGPSAPGEPAAATPSASAPADRDAVTTPSADVIAGYDGLTAREIIALVPAASPTQVAWMTARETEGKARKTVLRALGAE